MVAVSSLWLGANFITLAVEGGAAARTQICVDANFPGGNIVVDSIAGDLVTLRPDLRDTEGDWFYWYFLHS